MKIRTPSQIIDGIKAAKKGKWWFLHPNDPKTPDLTPRRQEELRFFCETVSHYAGHDVGPFLHTLVMMAGLAQEEPKNQAAHRYLQEVSGSVDLPPLLLAMDKVEGFRQALAREQALEQRKNFRDVKSCTAGQDGLVSRNPNLTKSYTKNPNRLRVVN